MAVICVTIGRGRHSSLLEEWQQAAQDGVDLVELRVDLLRSDPDLARLLATRHTPIIFTIRRGPDGGLWRGTEERRLRLIREAILAGVEYVDLEHDIAAKIPRYGVTKRVVSYHNLQETPEDLHQIVSQMKKLDPDVIKFAAVAHSVEDASRILDEAAMSTVPAIGIAIDPPQQEGLGVFTRILGAKYGAPWTYAGYNRDRIFAPGMLHYQDLQETYHYEKIDAETDIYAVIGSPIMHSLSPVIHNTAFRHLEINAVYVPLHIPPETLEASLDTLKWLHFRGFSVTIPHKEAILSRLTARENAVESTGSCNTVIIDEDDVWVGYNTDYRAAMDALEREAGGTNEDGVVSALKDRQALILGAGGVARSLIVGLMRRGVGVTITNRTEERAQALAEEMGCRVVHWSQRAAVANDLLINCTPVGMHPVVDESPMPPAGLKSGQIVFDTIYHPENTLLLKLAHDHRALTISGLEMFIRQGALQSQLFTGQPAPVQQMREAAVRALSPVSDP